MTPPKESRGARSLRESLVPEKPSRLDPGTSPTGRRGTDDRRQVLVTLTSEGEALLRELSILHRAHLRTQGPELIRALGAVVRGAVAPGVAAES
jgi:hypothetical protein